MSLMSVKRKVTPCAMACAVSPAMKQLLGFEQMRQNSSSSA